MTYGHLSTNVVAVVLVLLYVVTATAASVRPAVIHNFGSCGGAKSCLGVSKLERVRRRSGWKHQTTDQLARELDSDADLVSKICSPHAQSPHSL